MTAEHTEGRLIVRERQHTVNGVPRRLHFELRREVDAACSVLLAELIATDDEGEAVAQRLAACWNALTSVSTELIGEYLEHVETIAEAAAESDQWMKLCALLMHRYALKGETVVITAEEMARLDELYPEGTDLIADDGESGAVNLTLVPPGEQPTGIIVVEGGKPGQIVR